MYIRYRLAAAALFVVSLYGEDSSATLKGRIIGNEPSFADFVVELTNLTDRLNPIKLDVTMNGDFSARNLTFGDYTARITTMHGETIAQTMVTIRQPTQMLDLRLPERPASPTGQVVSARQLRNPPRRQAVDLALAAQRFSSARQFDKAATELEKAVKISPEYSVAHSNLGAQYLKLGKPREAEAEITKAIEIAGPNPADLGNLAFAHLAQTHIPEAMDAARQALKMQKNHPAAHYVLGITMILEPETRGEGMAHLEEAAKTMESARRAIAALEQLKQR